MRRASREEDELIPRSYGQMRMLAGGRNLETKNCDLRILEINPGSSTSHHFHEKSESVFHVLSGSVTMEVDETQVRLEAGDTLVIEPSERHVLRNTGGSHAVVIESMSPPFSKRDIFYIEDSQ